MTKRFWTTAAAIGFAGLTLSSCVSEGGYYETSPGYYRSYDNGPRYRPAPPPPQRWDRRDMRPRDDWRRHDDRNDRRHDDRRDNDRRENDRRGDDRHSPRGDQRDHRPDRNNDGRPQRDPRVWMQNNG